MPKRELEIPINNTLLSDTKEEFVFRSPATIPDKGIRDLIAVKKIVGSNCSYYDIAPTENQAMKKGKEPEITLFQLGIGDPTDLPESTNISESGELTERPTGLTEDVMAQLDNDESFLASFTVKKQNRFWSK